MNILGLWVISYIFKPTSRNLSLILIVISTLVGISLLFTNLQSYVGLSGALHGLFAFYALQEALNGRKSSWILLAGIIGKVSIEQFFGAPANTAELINARVAIEAHLIGLIWGGLLSFLTYKKTCRSRFR